MVLFLYNIFQMETLLYNKIEVWDAATTPTDCPIHTAFHCCVAGMRPCMCVSLHVTAEISSGEACLFVLYSTNTYSR